ncbi:hypothetical protein T484DRAFT_1749065 [Baffinella frigidus]|nr:hypothetical protein T484DRAFT_1749065 [Cryptophyta sp. CCMP2293]
MPEGTTLARERHRSGLVLTPPASVRSSAPKKPKPSEEAVKSWLRGTDQAGAPPRWEQGPEESHSSHAHASVPDSISSPSVDRPGSSLGPGTGVSSRGPLNSEGNGAQRTNDASKRYDRTRELHPRGDSETGAGPRFPPPSLLNPPAPAAPTDSKPSIARPLPP